MFLRNVCWLSPDYLWLYSLLLDVDCFFSFLIFYIHGRTPWTGISSSEGRYLHKQNKRTQTSMPRVGFDPTILVLERAKTVHAFDRAAGRDVAQAINHRFPTEATRVRAQVRSYGICDGQSGTGAGFLRELRFPLPILIQPTASHSSSSIIRGWCNRPVSGRRTKWTQSHPTPKKQKKK
jgi:hypothetical protein